MTRLDYKIKSKKKLAFSIIAYIVTLSTIWQNAVIFSKTSQYVFTGISTLLLFTLIVTIQPE
jgi:hypothetical protein